MKKIILLISVFLFWCSSSTQLSNEDSLVVYNWNSFSIDIPSSWEVMDQSWITNLSKPRDWNFELIVSSNTQDWNFANNLIILSKDLDEVLTSYEFMWKNDPKDYTSYTYFLEDKSEDFQFNDWEKTKLYVFSAKYNKDNDVLKFIQTWRVCNEKKSFFLTIGVSLNIKDTTKYEDILKTFKCD